MLGPKMVIPEADSRLPWVIRLIIWLTPGLVLTVLLVGGLFWFIRDHSAFHVVAVRVYGTERVSQAELIQLAQISRGMSLLRVNVERVRRQIVQHPWIRETLVRRVFPNELEIIVYERRPHAVLESASLYLIDAEGYILSHATPTETVSLPRLVVGPAHTPSPGERMTDPAVKAGLRLLAQAQDSPFFRNAVITHIDVVNAARFMVRTRLGKFIVGASLTDIQTKLEYFPVIDQALRASVRRAEYIDLSVENQIVVKTGARTTQGAGRLQRRGGGSGQAQ